MGDGAAEERNVAHAGETDVADEASPPAQQPRILLAQDARANAFS
jgi:hypothetical protein